MSEISAALREAAGSLEAISDTGRLDAELLMAEALGLSRSDLLLKASELRVPALFDDYVKRRLRHEPVAYILGRQEFYGREFLVNSDVLIPRGDSETVVELALAHCPATARILDLGTGSGALLLTMLAEMRECEGVGIDVSLGALAVAASNAAKLGVASRAHLLHRDWTEGEWRDGLGIFDVVIANPPYVEQGAALDKSVRDHEPAGALFAGQDGLEDYRILIPQLKKLLGEDGAAVLEIGHEQADSVAQLAHDSGFRTELHRDLAHRPRALLLR